MKKEAALSKKTLFQRVDKKDLVNLDFYNNEIRIMDQKLDQVITQHPDVEVEKKVRHLKHELHNQRRNLDEFRKNFDVEEMLLSDKPKHQDEKLKSERETDVIRNDENFFLHLQSFESTFKGIRQKVLEFIAEQATKME
jgi:hypothetical protein